MSGKRLTIYLAALVVAVAGFLLLGKPKSEQKTPALPAGTTQNQDGSQDDLASLLGGDEADEQAEAAFEAKCQNGEWVEIVSVEGSEVVLSGKLRRVYSDEELPENFKNFPFYVDGQAKTALSGSDLSALDDFEDRDVEVRGVKNSNGTSVDVSRVKCSGAETDKKAINSRTGLMNWIAANIDSIAPQKAPYQKWTVDMADFVDEKNVYIEYYDSVEDDENAEISEDVDTARMVLIEASAKPDGSYAAKVLAYWEMGEDDYVLKSGRDSFEEADDTYSYQYDPEEKSWTRI